MADIVVTAAKVAVIFPEKAVIFDMVAAATILAGQGVYQNSSGKADLADASAAGTAGFRGIALNKAYAGGAVSVLKEGHVAGFTLSQAYDAPIYVSDTAGALADAAGTVSTLVARVIPMADKDLTKVLYVEADWS